MSLQVQESTKSCEASAAIIVIGDEILKGQIQDANTIYLTKELKSCGVIVKRVLILPGKVQFIPCTLCKGCT